MKKAMFSSVADEEVSQFSRVAGDWWKADGVFAPLHRLNPVRLTYIRDQITTHFGVKSGQKKSLTGLAVLDVGCGGGLVSEPLARMGAKVTGLDASDEGIAAAKHHAKQMGLAIDYRVGSVEELAQGRERFDVITAMEIVEHVADMDVFIRSLAELLNPNGMIILSTLNRTPKSFLLGIVAAEYILRWVPHGTHQWKKFVRPSELVSRLETSGMQAIDMTGLNLNPVSGAFETRRGDVAVNYMLTAVRSA